MSINIKEINKRYSVHGNRLKGLKPTGNKDYKGRDIYKADGHSGEFFKSDNPDEANMFEYEQSLNDAKNDYLRALQQYDDVQHGRQGYDDFIDDQSFLKGTPTGLNFGGSQYDEEIMSLTGDSSWDNDIIQNTRAANQSTSSKLLNGTGKMAVTVGTTLANGTVGLLWGLSSAVAHGEFNRVWNNDFMGWMGDVSDWSEEVMPNYRSTWEEREATLWDKAGTANFWGDTVIKNLGFAIGAGLAGMVWVEAGVAMLGALNISAGIGAIGSTANAAFTMGLGAITSAMGEGAQEAKDTYEDALSKGKQQALHTYEENVEKIERMYNKDSSEYKMSMDKALEDYKHNYSNIQEEVTKAGNTDFLLNVAILTASNLLQFGKLYKMGYKGARAELNIAMREGKYVAGSTWKGAIRGAAVNSLTEGLEEFHQAVASEVSKSFYLDRMLNDYYTDIGREDKKEVDNFLTLTAKTWWDKWADPSAQEEFAVGALIGAMGIPTYKKHNKLKVGLAGGVTDVFSTPSQKALETKVANKLNEYLDEGNEGKKKRQLIYEGLLRHQALERQKEEAVKNSTGENVNAGSTLDYHDAAHKELIHSIIMFEQAGKLDHFVRLLEDTQGSLSDGELKSIMKNSMEIKTDEDGKKTVSGTYAKYGSINEEGKIVVKEANISSEDLEKLRGEISDNIQKIGKTIKFYRESKNAIDTQTKGMLKYDDLVALTFWRTQIETFKQRREGMSKYISDTFKEYIKDEDRLEEAINKVLAAVGQKDRVLTEEDKKALELILKTQVNARNDSSDIRADSANTKNKQNTTSPLRSAITYFFSKIAFTPHTSLAAAGSTKVNNYVEMVKAVNQYLASGDNVLGYSTAITHFLADLAQELNNNNLSEAIRDSHILFERSAKYNSMVDNFIKSPEQIEKEIRKKEEKERVKQEKKDIKEAIKELKEAETVQEYHDKLKEVEKKYSTHIRNEAHKKIKKGEKWYKVGTKKHARLRDKIQEAKERITEIIESNTEFNAEYKQILKGLIRYVLRNRPKLLLDKKFDRIKVLLDDHYSEEYIKDLEEVLEPYYEEKQSFFSRVSEAIADDMESNEAQEEESSEEYSEEYNDDTTNPTNNEDDTTTDPTTEESQQEGEKKKGGNRENRKNDKKQKSQESQQKEIAENLHKEQNSENGSVGREVQREKKLDNQKEKQGRLKPAVPEFGINEAKEGNFVPFPEAKDANKKDGSTNKPYKGFWTFLKNLGAFDYINRGNLQVGDKIKFVILAPNKANYSHDGRPIIYMVHEKGEKRQIVGSLSTSKNALEKHKGLESLVSDIEKRYEALKKEAQDDKKPLEEYEYPVSVEVKRINGGHIQYATDINEAPNIKTLAEEQGISKETLANNTVIYDPNRNVFIRVGTNDVVGNVTNINFIKNSTSSNLFYLIPHAARAKGQNAAMSYTAVPLVADTEIKDEQSYIDAVSNGKVKIFAKSLFPVKTWFETEYVVVDDKGNAEVFYGPTVTGMPEVQSVTNPSANSETNTKEYLNGKVRISEDKKGDTLITKIHITLNGKTHTITKEKTNTFLSFTHSDTIPKKALEALHHIYTNKDNIEFYEQEVQNKENKPIQTIILHTPATSNSSESTYVLYQASGNNNNNNTLFKYVDTSGKVGTNTIYGKAYSEWKKSQEGTSSTEKNQKKGKEEESKEEITTISGIVEDLGKNADNTVKTEDSNGEGVYKDNEGKEFPRVHTVIGSVNPKQDDSVFKRERDEQFYREPVGHALVLGTIIDEMFRQYFSLSNPNRETTNITFDFKGIKNALSEQDKSDTKSKRALDEAIARVIEEVKPHTGTLIKRFAALREGIENSGLIAEGDEIANIYTDRLVLLSEFDSGAAPVKVGGELDALIETKNGNLIVLDLKTFTAQNNKTDRNGEKFPTKSFEEALDFSYNGNPPSIDSYKNQVSMYVAMIEKKYGKVLGGKGKTIKAALFGIRKETKYSEKEGVTLVGFTPQSKSESKSKNGIPAYEIHVFGNKELSDTSTNIINERGRLLAERKEKTEKSNKENSTPAVEESNTPSPTKPSNSNIEASLAPTNTNAKGAALLNKMRKNKNTPKNRVVSPASENKDSKETKKLSMARELAWFAKTFPVLSSSQHLHIVKGLIKVANSGVKAWGQFKDSMIILSDEAASGTLFHEAFHSVFNLLMSEQDRNTMLEQAKEKWGSKSNEELEEDLAEAFREYMQDKENQSLGRKILNFFSSLFHKVTNWKYISPSIDGYYKMISEGRYSDTVVLHTMSDTIINNVNPIREKERLEKYNKLDSYSKDTLTSLGFTEASFSSLSNEVQDQIIKCM